VNRFEVLEKEINKGIKVDEKSNEVISNWSPNNVRRIVIGSNVAVVQYFVTGGRYSRLVEIVGMQAALQKDILKISQEGGKLKSILAVLTTGRVCSSVEEIVFSLEDYPEQMLRVDTDLTTLASTLDSLGSRFPRLRHISATPLSVKDIVDSGLLQETREGGKLLLDALKVKKVPVKTIEEPHTTDWWKGTSLRPRYYTMDGQRLTDYFDKVKESLGKVDKQETLKKLSEAKSILALERASQGLMQITGLISSMVKTANDVCENSSIVSKSEWSSVLTYRSMGQGIKKYIGMNEETVESFNKIDIQSIIDLAEQAPNMADIVPSLKTLEMYLSDAIWGDNLGDPLNYDLHSLRESIKELQNFAGSFLDAQCNIIMVSFVRYLKRNSLDYVDHFYQQIKEGIDSPIQYTRSMIACCNMHVRRGEAKQVMDKIGAVEVLVDNFPLGERVKTAKSMLKALSLAN
jgi:hypothetical protein